MHTKISHVHINNFKSIKNVVLNDCRRINLFIGKPNVGKSNLLEAMSLFCLPYLKFAKKRSIQQFIRVESDAELFFDGHIETPIRIETDVVNAEVHLDSMGLSFLLNYKDHTDAEFSLSFSNMLLSGKKNIEISAANPFRSYFYPNSFEKEKLPLNYLLPPNGSNLMNIVTLLPDLKRELTAIFKDYDLKYVFDTNSQEIKVLKEKNPGEIFLIPFHSIADSLQRMIFYTAAIESNDNAVLIFEEPEAHSYPPFISKVTRSIIDSENNQFFITTHSPYVVNDFLELPGNDLAIYLVDFRNGETIVKRAAESELQEMYEFGADLFFNTETFLK
ncbi:AAA family ATPase [Parabacteroides sp. W1-Q-101]|jgi:AAA15 family ATPase/GTPase|uniref:AAA family ATPase n=1 Tax=Parabacteroides segnis TaxID=2763058 RepID=A0ABR7E8E8_9BACT|nr:MULTISPECIES: AAA family ATPase [Parabacteroides]MBC5646046.1 AAA family ATPase [Parabacteroides segnis]MCM0715999.1 AAA family ATPase [Parabacteroides sp. TA-V-105]MCM0719525.1 AAA family ATPase [Parabacteroides sp. W1-Q-101]